MSAATSELEPSSKGTHRITRRRGACGACRSRKLRCDGAKPCFNCERISQECIYPELIPRRRKVSGSRAASACDAPQTTTPRPPITPSSLTTFTWPIDEDFSWTTAQTDLLSELDLSSVEDGTDLLNVPLLGEDEFFPDIGMQSPSGPLSLFEESLPDSERQGNPTADPQGVHHDRPQSSMLGDLHTSPTTTHAEIPELNPGGDLQQLGIGSLISPSPSRLAPVLDFSAASLYGLPILIDKGVPESTSSRVTRFMETLNMMVCCSRDAATETQHPHLACWNLDDEVMTRRWCDACFDEYPVNSFLNRAYSDAIIEQSRESNADALVSAFEQAILAIGFHFALLRDSSAPSLKAVQNDSQKLRTTLERYQSVKNSPDSLLKLQVLLLLAIISSLCDQSTMGDLMIRAVQCARSPQLFRLGHTQSCLPNSEQELGDRAMWFLYCIEADHAMHQGIPPLLDHDWITHSTSLKTCGQNELIADYSLFAFMHSVLRRQYSPSAMQGDPGDSPLDQMKQLKFNERRLKKWVARHPVADSVDQICDASRFLDSIKSSNTGQKRRLLHAFRLYHKAVFFMFCPWITALSANLDEEGIHDRDPSRTLSRLRSRCIEISLDSAFALIQVANHFMHCDTRAESRDISGVLTTWQDLNRLLPISLCLILFYVASGGKRERLRVMPYLGIFGALLGRMGLHNETGTCLDDYFKLITSEGFV